MSWLYENLARPILYSYDAELVHERMLALLAKLSQCQQCITTTTCVIGADHLHFPVQAFGLEFSNPVGLAAGLDKNAVALPLWPAFGFGFVEIGTVTFHPQPGNPRPRIFRLERDEALLNRLGFPSEGAEAVAVRLTDFKKRGLWPKIPVGINIGKSASIALPDATADYVRCFERLREFGDFFVINISSPNTPHLRKLQGRLELEELIAALQQVNRSKAATSVAPKPLLIKIAPDLNWDQLDDLIEACEIHGIAGIVATNTSTDYSNLKVDISNHPRGGLSGAPIRERATECVQHICERTQGQLPIIGVGGIATGADACEKIRAGASLIELYTGFVYHGPTVIRNIVHDLRLQLARDGFESVEEAIG